MASGETRGMTADEFWEWIAQPENEDRCWELERGKPIPIPATGRLHGVVACLVSYFLGAYSFQRKTGYVCSNRTALLVEENPDNTNFRVRDVAIPRELSEGRFEGRKDLRKLVDRMVRINDEAAADPVGDVDRFYEQGYSLVSSQQAQQAFSCMDHPEREKAVWRAISPRNSDWSFTSRAWTD